MNIEDRSSLVSWTNTTSTEFDSTANDTYPWYLGHHWGGPNLARYYPELYGVQPDSFDPLYRDISADTPVSRSATQTTTSEPGNYVWPLWMFVTVAVALTLGSVVLPLITPTLYRWLARLALRWRRTFRVFVSLLWMM